MRTFDVSIRLTPWRVLRIVREADGMWSCAVQQVYRIAGAVIRTDTWLGPNGEPLGLTTGIRFEPRLEAMLHQLTAMRLGRQP